MEMFGKELITSGFALVVLAQVVASIIAFRVNFAQGLCSLVVPGYLLVAMHRVGHYWKFLVA